MRSFLSIPFVAARSRWSALISALALAAVSANSLAAPGDLDSTFGSGFGKISLTVGAQADNLAATKRLPDGKRLLVGSCDQNTATPAANFGLCSVRINDNGTVDTTYGTNGRSVVPYLSVSGGYFSMQSRDVLLDSALRATVVGRCTDALASLDTAVCIARLTANGAIDTSFATNGFAIAPLTNYYMMPTRLYRVENEKLLVSGYCFSKTNSNQSALCSVRFNANGSTDTTYGISALQLNFITPTDDGADSALLPDGKLLQVGRCRANFLSTTPYQFCMQRILPNGDLDITFGTNGQRLTNVVTGNQTFVVAPFLSVAPDGTLTLIGRCFQAPPEAREYCMVRYTASGTVIPTQGSNVFLLPVFTNLVLKHLFLSGITLQFDGKYLLHGQCASANLADYDFCLARLNVEGSLDTTFSNDGYVETPISVNTTNGPRDFATALDIDEQGRATVIGTCVGAVSADVDDTYDFCVARYQLGPFNGNNCTPDIDGDGNLNAATDGLINLRVMLGMTGNGVVQDVPFLSNAKRTSWTSVRKYLTEQCGMTLGI